MLATQTDPHLRLRLFGWLIAAVFLTASAACGEDSIQREDPVPDATGDVGLQGDADSADAGDGETGLADVPPPGVPSDIETTLLTSNPRVGETMRVDCQLLDQNGEPITVDDEPDYRLVYSPRENFDTQSESRTLMPTVPGAAQVGCSAPSLSLVDETPEQIDVAPGPPHTVRTSLDSDEITAGKSAEATCDVYDEFGNELQNVDSTVTIDAMGAGIEVDDRTLTIEKTGIYRVTCQVDNAQREVGATLEVTPAVPANLTMTPSPQKMIYGLGEVVHFATIVTDEYGNRIPEAPIVYSIAPSATPFGHARWEFNKEGTFNVEARVDGETKDDKKLRDTAEIIVNGDGPSIACNSPSDGSEKNMRPGGVLKFSGSVDDAHGASSLTINGESVNIGRNGSFSTELTTKYGINFVDITATDTYGEENSRTCAFLVADRWHTPSDYLSDAVSFKMMQDALDDGNRNEPQNPLNSLADILDTVLDSSELLERLDTQLRNSNPLKPRSCDWDTWVGCAHYSEIRYIREADGSPGLRSDDNDVQMSWVNDGMDVDLTLNDVGVRLEIDSSVCGTLTGWLDINQLDLSMITDLELKNGQLSASLRPNSLSVDAQGVSPDFDGVCGTLAGYLEGILQDLYQNTVEDTIKDALENNINDVLDDLFGALDIASLNSNIDVPSLSGNDSVGVDFNVRYSRLDVSSSDALMGLGTRFEPDTVQNSTPSKGVPLPDGDILLDPTTNQRLAAGVHVGVLNHVLHTVWRGGLFDTEIGSSLLGGDTPDGTEAELSLDLPPVARLQGSSKVELMLGAATVELTYPGLFDKPIEFQVGLVAETGVNIQGNQTLDFNNIKLTEFYFTPTDVSLDSDSRDVIESFLRDLFQGIVDRSLNSALPSLPIPSFTITPAIGQYGLPNGAEIGVKNPNLGGTNRHFILEGSFGKQ